MYCDMRFSPECVAPIGMAVCQISEAAIQVIADVQKPNPSKGLRCATQGMVQSLRR